MTPYEFFGIRLRLQQSLDQVHAVIPQRSLGGPNCLHDAGEESTTTDFSDIHLDKATEFLGCFQCFLPQRKRIGWVYIEEDTDEYGRKDEIHFMLGKNAVRKIVSFERQREKLGAEMHMDKISNIPDDVDLIYAGNFVRLGFQELERHRLVVSFYLLFPV